MDKKELADILQKNDSDTGTTSPDYANALNWSCGLLTNKTIILKNTDSSNGLKYKVLVYAYDGGNEYEEVAETTLSAGDIVKIVLNYSYAVIKVQVKDAVSGTHATYRVDYIGING